MVNPYCYAHLGEFFFFFFCHMNLRLTQPQKIICLSLTIIFQQSLLALFECWLVNILSCKKLNHWLLVQLAWICYYTGHYVNCLQQTLFHYSLVHWSTLIMSTMTSLCFSHAGIGDVARFYLITPCRFLKQANNIHLSISLLISSYK